MLDKSVNSTITGTSGSTPDFGASMTTGFAGQDRALANADAGTRWLASGQTPDDINQKASEQNIRNLAAFYSGETPESSFRSLTGAQQTPTPQGGNPQLPQLPSNLAQVATGTAVNNYSQQVTNALNTPNPWMQGLSAALQIGGIAAMA